MNQNMKTGVVALLAAVGLAGCDPWPDENKAAPQVVRVIAVDPNALGGSDPTGSVTATTPDAQGVYQLAGLDYQVSPAVPADPTTTPPTPAEPEVRGQASVIVVQANKLLDGASIQTSKDDCTPAAGSLTISPAPPAGATWYTCYNPTSPTTDQGGSVMVYAGDDPVDPGSAANFSFPVGTVVTITGSVKDQGGTALPVNVVATFSLAP